MPDRRLGRGARVLAAVAVAAVALTLPAIADNRGLDIFTSSVTREPGTPIGTGGDGSILLYSSFTQLPPSESPILPADLASSPYLAPNLDLFSWEPGLDAVSQFTATSNIENDTATGYLAYTGNDQPAVVSRTYRNGDLPDTQFVAVAFRSNADQSLPGPTATKGAVDPRILSLASSPPRYDLLGDSDGKGNPFVLPVPVSDLPITTVVDVLRTTEQTPMGSLSADAASGATRIALPSAAGLSVGNLLQVQNGVNKDFARVTSVAGGGETATANLSAKASIGATEITLSSVAGLSVGDFLRIRDSVAGGVETAIGNLSATAAVGAIEITLSSVVGLSTGDLLRLQDGVNQDFALVVSVSGSVVGLNSALFHAYASGAASKVTRVDGETAIGNLSADAAVGATQITLSSVAGLSVGDLMRLQDGANQDSARVVSLSASVVGLGTSLAHAYVAGLNSQVHRIDEVNQDFARVVSVSGLAVGLNSALVHAYIFGVNSKVTRVDGETAIGNLSANAAVGATQITLSSVGGLSVGSLVLLQDGANQDSARVASVTGPVVGLDAALVHAYASGVNSQVHRMDSLVGLNAALLHTYPSGAASVVTRISGETAIGNLSANAATGADQVTLSSVVGLSMGNLLRLQDGLNQDFARVVSLSGPVVGLDAALRHPYTSGPGSVVTRMATVTVTAQVSVNPSTGFGIVSAGENVAIRTYVVHTPAAAGAHTVFVWDSEKKSMINVLDPNFALGGGDVGSPSIAMRVKVSDNPDPLAGGKVETLDEVLVAFSGNLVTTVDDPDSNSEVYLWSRKAHFAAGGGGVINNGGVSQLTHTLTGNCWSPTVSEAGDVAFLSNSADLVPGANNDGGVELFVWSKGALTQVTKSGSAAVLVASPRWAAKGSRLVFTSNADGNNEIYTWNRHKVRQITRTSTGGCTSPSIDPGGQTIAFLCDGNLPGVTATLGKPEVVVMNSSGHGIRQVTHIQDAGHNGAPILTRGRSGPHQVTWVSDSDLDGRNSSNLERIYRVSIR
jgi:hypothetical protein